MRKLAAFFFHKILGWTISGQFPDIPKCVVAVVPHTHWMDFFLGLLVRKVIGVQINYIGKKTLFKPPYGWFFRYTGGAPIDRSGGLNNVQAIAAIFKSREVFRLGLSPEGTRKKVDRWKTGFYHIAQEAKVPIVLVAFDFGAKNIRISEPQYPTGNLETDFQTYQKFFEGVVGYVPEYT
jgi:1-acyl-sn-glycerol-3-phosphate acyltransferase